MNLQWVVQLLKQGTIGVIPTDTIYGIVGSALKPNTVEEIYRLRKRSFNKPFIVLISKVDDLKKFDVKLTDQQKEFLEKIWPNPVSVVLSCPDGKFKYLHRGTNSLAFRMPKNKRLLELLKNAGPLVAPSANIEGEKPSQTIDEAKKYFGSKINFYVDGGKIRSKPSMLVAMTDDWVKILRGDSNFSSKIKQLIEKLGFEFDQS